MQRSRLNNRLGRAPRLRSNNKRRKHAAPAAILALDQLLGMALHPNRPRLGRALDRLDQPVVGPADRAQIGAKGFDRLVVQGVDRNRAAAKILDQPGFWQEIKPMRLQIALFLIEKGARIDLFAAAMLGQLDVVKRLVKANPNVARSVGPHGISLLAHATVGGDEAKAVADCLATVEGSGNGLSVKPLTAAEKARYAGTYELAGGGGTFEITLDKERLSFVSGMSTMRIHFLGDHEFFSAGVPSVRFRFDAAGEMAAVVTITDHDTVITGKRSA